MVKSDDEDEYQMEADMEQMWAMRESGQADDDAAAVGLSHCRHFTCRVLWSV